MSSSHAQRSHLIQSLDSFLYQLHSLSFFLSPSIWPYIARLFSQYQFARPTQLHPKRPFFLWLLLIAFFNFPSFWSHISSSHSRSVLLDFVGIEHKPTVLHLILLDLTIVTLQCLLILIAFESSFHSTKSLDSLDSLLPSSDSNPESRPLLEPASAHIIDLNFPHILNSLRSAPVVSPLQETTSPGSLPLPNTTAFQVPAGFRLLMESRARRIRSTRANPTTTPGVGTSPRRTEEPRTPIPGDLDMEGEENARLGP